MCRDLWAPPSCETCLRRWRDGSSLASRLLPPACTLTASPAHFGPAFSTLMSSSELAAGLDSDWRLSLVLAQGQCSVSDSYCWMTGLIENLASLACCLSNGVLITAACGHPSLGHRPSHTQPGLSALQSVEDGQEYWWLGNGQGMKIF